MHPLPLRILVFSRGPESVKNRMMKLASWFLIHLHHPSPILLGRSWVDLGLHSVHPHPFPSPGLQSSASHYPSRHDQRSPTSLEVSLVAEPAVQAAEGFKKNESTGTHLPKPQGRSKVTGFLWSAIVSISVVIATETIATLPFWWVIVACW